MTCAVVGDRRSIRLSAEWKCRVVALLMGSGFALSAPGFDQGWLVWGGMVGLLVLTCAGKDPWYGGVRGFYFALGYNLVYLSWILGFRREYGEGVFALWPQVIGGMFWVLLGMRQALYFSMFCCIAKAIPMVGGFWPTKEGGKIHAPSLVVLPVLWFVVEKLTNIKELTGAPWTVLEYSQYKQPVVLQCASVVGGSGLGALIVLVNAALAGVVCYKFFPQVKALAFRTRSELILNVMVVASILVAALGFGVTRLQSASHGKLVEVAAVQSGLSERVHGVDLVTVFNKNLELCAKAPRNSLVVWPEWSMSMNFADAHQTLQMTSDFAAQYGQSWIIGLFDEDRRKNVYNSVAAVDPGRPLSDVYHKQFLVAVGEFTPDWVKYTPLGMFVYGPNKKYTDSAPGNETTVFRMAHCAATPLLCFESVIPQLSVDGVRKGATLLVDCSDTSWFRKSILGDQMIAFAVMRAVETHRSFVFSTVLGPSVIVDSNGRILAQADREKSAVISGKVPIETDTTPFVRWSF